MELTTGTPPLPTQIELNGLRVPAIFDCNPWNANGSRWSRHDYYYAVPSRWWACEELEAQIKAGISIVVPRPPLIDDEYVEHVAVRQSVLRARANGAFVMAEIGARWGPWGFRAAALARVARPDLMPLHLHYVEPNQAACDGIHAVAKLNSFRAWTSVDCTLASARGFAAWAARHEHIDLVDIDIQGFEQYFVPQIAPILQHKVYRVIVGTHGLMGNNAKTPQNVTDRQTHCHERVRAALQDWILVHELRPAKYYRCIQRYLRGNPSYPTSRFDWQSMQRKGCYQNTSFGPVAAWDGELILDNPRFVGPARKASWMAADERLPLGELLATRARGRN